MSNDRLPTRTDNGLINANNDVEKNPGILATSTPGKVRHLRKISQEGLAIQDVIKLIKSRRSIRKYRDQEVPREILEDLVDCGRLAPSGYNRQPWVFVVLTEKELKQKLAELCQWGRFLQEAGAAILIFCEKEAETALEDACAAAENIIIAASAYGLGTCWVNSYRKAHSEAVKQLVRCPEHLELAVILAVGYPEAIPPAPKKKALAEVLRWQTF